MTSPNFDFDSLPDEVILQIMGYLPFKDQVRQSGINRRFHQLSKTAIAQRKTLILDEDLMNYVIWNRPFGALLQECSPILETIISTDNIAYWCPMVMEPIFRFFYPKLEEIEIKRCFDDLKMNCSAVDYVHDSCLRMIGICPNLKSFSLDIEVEPQNQFFQFRFPDDVKSTNLEKLSISKCDDESIKSMTGAVPKLKNVNIGYNDAGSDVFDNFFATTPVLEKVAVKCEEELDLGTYFWRLPLKSFQLGFSYNCDKNVSDQLIETISRQFPNLENLGLAGMEITDAGFRAIGSLRALRCLDLSPQRVPEMHNIGHLANCVKLEKLRLYHSCFYFLLPLNAFVTIIQSCQKLNTLVCLGVHELESADAVIQILPSFANVKRRLKIGFGRGEAARIWKSDTILAALKQLKENGGAEIEILDKWRCTDKLME